MLAVLDCPTGLAGNMLLAALFDLGVPASVIDEPLAALGLAGRYRLELEQRRSSGLRGLHLQVHGLETEPPHRHWQELQQLLLQAPLAEPLRQRVLAVFALLAEAEAAVHGIAAERVHFHEVGAIDALVDVVGVCAALLHLGVDSLICTPPPAGHGQVLTAHGPLPLPAPAVLEIARRHAIPLAASEGFPPAELTTPTGLALAAGWASRFGVAPALLPRQVGVGLGSRSLDRPNLLRLVLGESLDQAPSADVTELALQTAPALQTSPTLQTVVVQQAQIDDASPEDLAFLADQLRQAGALDVFSQAITMKKGRLGQLLSVVATPDQLPVLRQVWWRHSPSLGLREQQQQRWALQRRHQQCATPLGPVRIKWALQPDGQWRSKIEHDDLAALASRHGLALAQVRALIDDLMPPDDDHDQP
jgi:uncharacterized protein (TIGR00299 family) protein